MKVKSNTSVEMSTYAKRPVLVNLSRPVALRMLRLLITATMLVSLAGCLMLNDVTPLSIRQDLTPNSRRSVVIYGIGIEEAWGYPQFAVALDEYSVQRQSITGNCWRFNRMQATVPGTLGTVQHFAFDVEPGYYVYSGYNAVGLAGPRGFVVPANRIVYLGDFIYSAERKLDLRRNLGATMGALKKAQPNLKANILLAETMPISTLTLFLCAP